MPRTHLAHLAVAVAIVVAGCGDEQRVASGEGGAPEYEVVALVLEDRSHGPELCLGGVATSDPPQCGGVPVPNWEWADVPWREERAGTTLAGAHVRGTYDGESFTLTAPPARPDPRDQEPPEEVTFPVLCAEPEVVDPSHGVEEYEEASDALFGASRALPEVVAMWVSNAGPGEEPFVVNVVVRPGNAAEARRLLRSEYLGRLCVAERDQPTAAELDAVADRLVELLGDEVLSGGPDQIRGVVEMTVVLETEEMRRAVVEEFGEGVVELESRLRPVGGG